MKGFFHTYYTVKHAMLKHCVLCFFLCFAALQLFAGPNDSLKIASTEPIFNQTNNGVAPDNSSLTKLVDQLLNMDSIPDGYIEDVQEAIEIFNNNITKNIKKSPSKPAEDIYSTWEINTLFSQKDIQQIKNGNSIELVLEGGIQGDYFHPYKGVLTSKFGWRDSAQHNGVDIDLRKGDKVVAAFDGMVRIAKRAGGFGNVVIIRHYNGLETVYGHLSKIKVKSGQVVLAGQIIGLGGSTGHSTGPHLHFELRYKGIPINPSYLISFQDCKLISKEVTIKKTKWGLSAYPTNTKEYTVQRGDTILGIAKRFATTTSSIKELNGLPDKTRLKVGQVINVMQ